MKTGHRAVTRASVSSQLVMKTGHRAIQGFCVFPVSCASLPFTSQPLFFFFFVNEQTRLCGESERCGERERRGGWRC